MDKTVKLDTLVGEMREILTFLYDENKTGNRLRISDVSAKMGRSLSLDFADYFKFLKRYNYVVINRRDHSLTATDEGRVLARDGSSDEFEQELRQHFGDMVEGGQALLGDEEVVGDIEQAMDSLEMPAEPAAEPEPAPEADFKPRARPPAPSPSKARDAGTKLDSRYTRYESLGSGGIGTVFKGRLNTLALDVAIKEIKELFTYFNFLQRSEVIRHLREVVGQMALLQHPLIVKIIDQNVEVAHPFFVMEYLPDGNLKTRMASGESDIEHCLVWFLQACYALKAAHKDGVCHGNLKPENLLLDSLGNVRLTDFGMTRLLQTDAKRSIPRVVTGTIGYLSPEQMQGDEELNPSTDIYALGIMLYEMLTGNLPGRRSRLPSEVNKDIPKSVDDLFDRMTRDNPDDRFPDIDALLDEFYKAFKDKGYLAKGKMILFADTPISPEKEADEQA
ncbi:MAG: serine/threonine protein kinase [Deltaproteobacteria bacterium]|nr:serine/threonine protein kinase [Deltaproteobacteria bacterium]